MSFMIKANRVVQVSDDDVSAFLSNGYKLYSPNVIPVKNDKTLDYSIIMDELRAVAALHEIDISHCETRDDIYSAFIAFGQGASAGNTEPPDFESMSDEALVQYAALHEIDISKARGRPAVIVLLQKGKQGGE